MRLVHVSAVLLLTAASSFHAQSPKPASEAGPRRWLDDFKNAFEARDTKALMALYTPDIVAYDIVPPLQYVGLDAYGKNFAGFFSQYKGPLTVEDRDCDIHSSGDLAIVTCLQHVSGTLTSGQTSSVWLRVTSGLRKVNGKWLNFHDHVSVPADMETGKARMDLQP
jgi:ketosteroid isomerase-like protein